MRRSVWRLNGRSWVERRDAMRGVRRVILFKSHKNNSARPCVYERDCDRRARHIVLRVRASRAVDDGGHADAVVQDDVAARHVDDADEEDDEV